MAQLALHASANHFDMEQILSESQQRWLRTPEICEILRNYKRFSISPEPPHLPPSGSLFLYDRKVLRYFRKDGHSWRKKKDGKTIKEAHEKLKAGSVDVLHCYYAHGEDNGNFQRRSYWMLEEEFSHIVLVHYREVKVSMEDCDSYSGLACEQKDTTDGKLHESHGTDHMRIDGHTVQAMDYGLQMRLADGSCKGDEQVIKSSSNMPIDNILSLSSAGVNLDSPFEERTLKKNDSFSQWMSKELGDVESVTLSSSGAYWDNVDIGSDCPSISPQSELDPYTIGPSLSQHQLFRIIDFSPNWAYAGCRTKVLIAGEFLKTRENISDFQWSCMFGEVEVPAEVINNGVLRCYTPLLDVARIPFYITCSNRLACSEIREFEYRHRSINDLDGISSRHECEALRVRFAKLLSRGSGCYLNTLPSCGDNSHLCSEITSLLKGDNEDWNQILTTTSGNEHYTAEVIMRLAEKLLKEKLCEWIINKIVEGGKDLRIFDENGQGVLHLAAALGYDWAISPTVIAGVNINFRDLHGWTALHWAAFYGRERMVVYLISLGASAGALTDPIPTYPMGRTAADLASENGHKGIAGYLAESALSAHLECLTFKDGNGLCNTHVITYSEPIGTPISDGDSVEGISLKDSLTALCNATQAAARIHQVYRMQSFQRKKITDLGDGISGKLEIDADRAVSLITMKTHKQSHRDEPVHAAAVRIQNKFRSWKSRRQFLSLRHQVVKIQAHIRGHQVRKNYRKFVWSVGIVEKVILRWRRKRNGLRGFKPESLAVEPLSEGTSQKEDDYDFLKKGRKQAEERTQKALSRVKSMVRHPEARDQYHRLLSTVTEIRKMKNECRGTIAGASGATSMDNNLIDVDVVLNDGSISAE